MKPPGRFFERDENLIVLMGLIGGVALALTLLAVYAWIIPESESQTRTLASYEHTGRYTYSVTTAPSALNPDETIGPVLPEQVEDSGEPPPPIFTRLARGLEFIYVYQVQGASDVSGTVSAELEIKAGTSWTQRLPLAGPVEFNGATGGIEGVVDFTQVAALLQQVEEQTGVTSGSVDLTIVPTVDVQGTANGQQFDETYSSPLTFTYTSNLITPGETLSFTEPRTITATAQRDNEINLFGGSVLVSTVRDVATPLAVATLALSGVFAAVFFLGVGRSEVATVRSRFRGLIVPVAEVESLVSHRISVGSLLDLAQLAKRENRSLFVREFENGSQAYLMHDGMVIYEYTVGDVPQGWIRSPAAVAVAAPPSLAVAETAVAPELLHVQPEAPLVVEEAPPAVAETADEAVADAIEEEILAIAEAETVEEFVPAPAAEAEPAEVAEAVAVEEEILAIPEAETVEEFVTASADEEVPAVAEELVEEEILAIADAESVEDFVTAPADEEVVAAEEAEPSEESALAVVIEEEIVTPEAVEAATAQPSEVDEILRVIAEVAAGEEPTAPAEVEAEAIIAEEAIELPATAPASYEDRFGVIEEAIEELTSPATDDEEIAAAVEEFEEPAAAIAEEVHATAEAETLEEIAAPSAEAEAPIPEEAVELAVIAPTSYEELLGVVEETAEEITSPSMSDQEPVATIETIEEPAAVEEEGSAIVEAAAETETAEEPAVAAATEAETALAEVIEQPVASAAMNEEPAEEAQVASPEAVEIETTDASFEPIPEWLTAAYEYEEPDEAVESAEASEPAADEEAAGVSAESNGLDHAAEEPTESLTVSSWATPRVEMESTSTAETDETEEAPVAVDQPHGDPAYLAWRRPLEVASDSTQTAVEPVADGEQAETEIEAEPASEEPTEPSPSPAYSHIRTPGYTRAHSPRTAVRRWLRNRSGGPLLDDVHVRESSVRTVASEPEEPAHVTDFQDAESNAVYEEPSPEIVEPEVIQTSAAQVDEPELQPEVELPQVAEAPIEQSEPETIDAAPLSEVSAADEAQARPNQQPAALDRKLVRYARRWLRDFLAESDERPNQR